MPEHNIDSNNQQQEINQKIFSNIIRVKHDTENPYVMLNREAMRDPKLSLEAVGLWARLLSNKDNWQIHVTQLMEANNCGRDKMYRILKELITNGYAFHAVDRTGGKYTPGTWYVFESKKTEEDIKKMFPFTENPYTAKPNTANRTLRNTKNKKNIDKKEYVDNAPPEGDANESPSSLSDTGKKPLPKSPFRTVCLIERVPNHPSLEKFKKYFDRPLVGIDERDHQDLIAKHGEHIVLGAYAQLAEWKLSKAEVEPKAVTKHTDLQRLKKWVIKEVIANPESVSGLASKRKWAIGIDKAPVEEKAKRQYSACTKSEQREIELVLYLERKQVRN